MAEFDAWGPAASGSRLWEMDQLAFGLKKAQIEDTQAQAGERKAKTTKENLEIENLRRFQSLMEQRMGGGAAGPGGQQGAAPGQPADQAQQIENSFWDLAGLSAQAGLMGQAGKLAGTASLISMRRVQQETSRRTGALRQLQTIAADADVRSRTIGTATNQEEWDQQQQAYEMQTGKRSPFRDVQFSPEAVDQVNQSAMTAKQRADEAEKAALRANLKNYRNSRLSQFDTENEIRQRRLDLAAQREERLARAGGGKAITPPSDRELKAAKVLVKKEFPGIENQDEAAYSIASDARAIMRANPALDSAGALARAYQNARDSGDFTTTSSRIPFTQDKTKFGNGKSSASPKQIPLASGKIDTGKLTPKTWYLSPSGVPGMWNGKAFVLADPAAHSDPEAAGVEPGDDDDEED